MVRSIVSNAITGVQGVSSGRTSTGSFVSRGHDKIVEEIENRISEFTFLPVGGGKPRLIPTRPSIRARTVIGGKVAKATRTQGHFPYVPTLMKEAKQSSLSPVEDYLFHQRRETLYSSGTIGLTGLKTLPVCMVRD
ncbi:hypothetical protein Bca52824_090538 [Brassica carinata]|uniref:Uncharacterized protein n=1 Tax=Brassica carinata TaxID=52824 RepID=A0A8X7NZ23_BRACI|nr:hypothetical protein Bca52824_090538 [Brassica carinata]